jgi:hypothetical protein
LLGKDTTVSGILFARRAGSLITTALNRQTDPVWRLELYLTKCKMRKGKRIAHNPRALALAAGTLASNGVLLPQRSGC